MDLLDPQIRKILIGSLDLDPFQKMDVDWILQILFIQINPIPRNIVKSD